MLSLASLRPSQRNKKKLRRALTLTLRGLASGSTDDPAKPTEKNRCRQRVDRRYTMSPTREVPHHIVRPPYAESGRVFSSFFPEKVILHDEASIRRMRAAARLARAVLDLACQEAQEGMTTDEIDLIVHEAICGAGAYPSPLNYSGFPKSLCASVNEGMT